MTFAVVIALAFGMTACKEKTTAEKAGDAAKSAENDVRGVQDADRSKL